MSSLGKRWKLSEETKKRIRLSHRNFLGKKHSKDTKGKIGMAIKELGIRPPSFQDKKHTIEARIKISDAQRGDKNHNWQGGITNINYKIRNSMAYKEWRLMVFGRDNYTCQECGGRGGYLQAHHILSFAQFPEYRFEVWNGITLCKEYHERLVSR